MAKKYDSDRLNDAQWARLAPLMPGGCRGKREPRTNNRLFMDAIFWMARSGARWRDLPGRFGYHRIVKRRYYDWVARGVLHDLFQALSWDGISNGCAWTPPSSAPISTPAGRVSKKGA